MLLKDKMPACLDSTSVFHQQGIVGFAICESWNLAMMKFIINASLLAFASLPLVSAGGGIEPTVTTAPAPTRIAARATTSFYSFVTTPIPNNDRSIGMGLQREGTDEYC
jgi:hypothetical protein